MFFDGGANSSMDAAVVLLMMMMTIEQPKILAVRLNGPRKIEYPRLILFLRVWHEIGLAKDMGKGVSCMIA